MPPAEFEEKCFEGVANRELASGSPLIFTPGQVAESVLGFDAAMHTYNSGFWKLWGRPVGPGAIAQPGAWGGASGHLPVLPNFRLNLFLQYKRPDVLVGPPASEWPYWNQTYFRYNTVNHQQAALELCANQLGTNGLVVYASPTFSTYQALFAHTVSRTLVANSNFVEISELSNHSRYTYIAAGNDGYAFSKPTKVKSISMTRDLPQRLKTARKLDGETNILKLAVKSLLSVAKKRKLLRDEKSRNLEKSLDEALHAIQRMLPSKALHSNALKNVVEPYLRGQYLSWRLGWTWLVVGGPRRGGR